MNMYLMLTAYDESLLCEKVEDDYINTPYVCAQNLEKS